MIDLRNGDCLEVLKNIEDNSVDLILTDPPYHLTSIVKRFGKKGSAPASTKNNDGSFSRLSKGFMGKEWDGLDENGVGIAFNVEVWKEAYRVLKPGGYCMAFSGSRTYHRMAVAIEDAGFEIKDMIEYIYGSGFPKSLDISKNIQKSCKNGQDFGIMECKKYTTGEIENVKRTKKISKYYLRPVWERDIQETIHNEEEQREILQSFLQKQSISSEKSPTTDNVWREQPCLERWYYAEKTERELQRCKICEMSERVYLNGEERWLCNGTPTCNGSTSGETIEEGGSCPSYRPQSSEQQNRKSDVICEQYFTQNIRGRKSDLAKQYEGYKTQLKPAHEPICLAMKPLSEKTFAENVMKWGTGGLNIDGTRIGNDTININGGGKKWRKNGAEIEYVEPINEIREGRYPANFIISGDIAPVLDKQSKEASRFFYNAKIEEEDYMPFYYTAKASKKERNSDIEGNQITGELKGGVGKGMNNSLTRPDGSIRKEVLNVNNHATVKPKSILTYLLKLGLPPIDNAVVLDLFAGSGSLGLAIAEVNKETGRNHKAILIEKDTDHCEIIKKRCCL